MHASIRKGYFTNDQETPKKIYRHCHVFHGTGAVVIMAGINTANYTNVCRNADMRIHVIAENNGKFPESPAADSPLDDNQTPPEPKKEKELIRRDISPESAFDTRFSQ